MFIPSAASHRCRSLFAHLACVQLAGRGVRLRPKTSVASSLAKIRAALGEVHPRAVGPRGRVCRRDRRSSALSLPSELHCAITARRPLQSITRPHRGLDWSSVATRSRGKAVQLHRRPCWRSVGRRFIATNRTTSVCRRLSGGRSPRSAHLSRSFLTSTSRSSAAISFFQPGNRTTHTSSCGSTSPRVTRSAPASIRRASRFVGMATS